MKKVLTAAMILTLGSSLAACGEVTSSVTEQESLVIFQNKIEIDAALRNYATAWGTVNNVDVEVKSCGGDTCQYGTQILAEFQSSEQPDIFVIEGMGGYDVYKDKILELDGEAWVDNTSLEFKVDGKVYGFPVAVEGWGMGYNKDILEAAGVNVADLSSVSVAEYATIFQKVQDEIDDGLTVNGVVVETVVSMAASSGMTWVTGLHNFNGYLSSGLAYDDHSVIDKLNDGIADLDRLNALANWVEVLYNYADEDILLAGTYDSQVGEFASGKAAFVHQGNWIDPNLVAANATFPMGYAPHATAAGENDSLFIGAPSYYVINKDASNTDVAKKFLNDLAASPYGHDYMVNQAKMVPAFDSVVISPTTPLSAALLGWSQAGKAYAWWQNDMPANFGMNILGPVYELYAKGDITKAQFVEQLKLKIEELA